MQVIQYMYIDSDREYFELVCDQCLVELEQEYDQSLLEYLDVDEEVDSKYECERCTRINTKKGE